MIAFPVASAGYWLLAVGLVHRTVGQQILGLRVVRAGELIGPPRQLLRCTAAAQMLLSLGVGYVWSIIDRDYRSWVDHLSGTSIVRAASLSAPVSCEADELSTAAIDVSSFNVDGSRSVAEAFAARGH